MKKNTYRSIARSGNHRHRHCACWLAGSPCLPLGFRRQRRRHQVQRFRVHRLRQHRLIPVLCHNIGFRVNSFNGRRPPLMAGACFIIHNPIIRINVHKCAVFESAICIHSAAGARGWTGPSKSPTFTGCRLHVLPGPPCRQSKAGLSEGSPTMR